PSRNHRITGQARSTGKPVSQTALRPPRPTGRQKHRLREELQISPALKRCGFTSPAHHHATSSRPKSRRGGESPASLPCSVNAYRSHTPSSHSLPQPRRNLRPPITAP